MDIAMYNEFNKVCIACEAIMLAKRSRAYMFLVNFVFENTPGRKPKEVLLVTGDGLFAQAQIE